MPNFTTGPTLIPNPDTLILKYNNCTFGPLFETSVSGKCVKDNANRTVKFIEYSIAVDGYVTLPDGATNIGGTMATLYSLLTAQAGQLVYKGRALDIVSGSGSDVAWGPVPELLEFQPLGGGRSAKISWKVTTRLAPPSVAVAGGGAAANFGLALGSLGIIQLNYETSVSYDEAGFSSISIKGTIEGPPQTRGFQKERTIDYTVDRYRSYLDDRILKGIDLGRFHVTRRNFNISRDKRTMEWDFEAEEKPYMDLPPYCTIAHGSYNVRPVKSGPGLNNWLCTLRATYTVAAGQPRKMAYWAFLSLMFLRMQQSGTTTGDDTPPKKPGPIETFLEWTTILALKTRPKPNKNSNLSPKPWLMDFSIDEGLYLDSRTVSFSATWRLLCRLSQILMGSGTWRKLPEGLDKGTSARSQKNNLWAQSMTLGGQVGNIMGSKSWLPNQLDPKLDVIIDMGSTEV